MQSRACGRGDRKERNMNSEISLEKKKGISEVGFRYTVFGITVVALQFFIRYMLRTFVPELVEEHQIFLSFLMIIVTVDIIGFPLIYMMLRNKEKVVFPKKSISFGKYILGVFMVAGICGTGAIVGFVVNMMFTLPFGINPNDSSAVVELMMNSGWFMRVLTVGILAPIFEELIFRKVLIDHLAKYGKVVAIVASGLLFGLFHGNFSQFFFAAGLGFFFAYIYVTTGKIQYTMGYHMIVNLTTSVITLALTKNYLNAYYNTIGDLSFGATPAGDSDAIMKMAVPMIMYLGWLGILALCALVGVILLIVNFKKFHVEEEEGALKVSGSIKAVLTNPGMLCFFAFSLLLFAEAYLLPILGISL